MAAPIFEQRPPEQLPPEQLPPEKMSGISGPNILYLLDEASGIPEPLFDAIEGNRAGGARMVMFSNPTRTSGTFYEAFGSKRQFWHRLRVSSAETPNVTHPHDPSKRIPGLATLDWLQEKKLEWGEGSPAYRVRVEGKFPDRGASSVIPLSLVDDAVERREGTETDCHQLDIGVDVAHFGGDETVIFYRRGKYVFDPIVLSSMDTVEVANRVLKLAREKVRGSDRRKPRVKVDSIGVGAGVADQLSRHHADLSLVAVNVATKADDEDQYTNLRAQLWFGARDWLASGGTLPRDSKLEGELVAAEYSFDARGRYLVEKKDVMRSKLRRSPDRADAFALCVYTGRAAPSRVGHATGAGSEASRLGDIL